MIIYKVTNRINNKIYIGQTRVTIERRWQQHCTMNKCKALYRSIQKYGKENFTIEEIDGANSLSELNYLEQHYIHMYNSMAPNGYNLTSGGYYYELSEESKRRISENNKGRIITEEQRMKISSTLKIRNTRHENSFKGKKHTKESTEKMSKSHKNVKLSEEHRKSISKSLIGNTYTLGHKQSEETKKKISKALLGNKYSLGCKHTQEHKDKIRETKRKNKENKLKNK